MTARHCSLRSPARRFAAAVADVAALLPLDAIRRPSTAAEPLAIDQPPLEHIA